MVRPAEVPPGFAAWYEAHHPRLVTVLRAVTTDADAAADAADEAMVRCLLHWERVRHMASPAGWTYRVALNELRRVGRRRALEQRLLRRLPPPRTVTEQDHEDLAGLLAGLSVRQRTAVALRYGADLPEAEIAALMGVTRGTVASTLADARRALAARLSSLDTEEAVDA